MVRAQTRTGTMTIYGLVYEIHTGSREPGGRAVVRGRTYSGRELFDAEIYHEHPDLAEVLQTEFSAFTIGFVQENHISHYLPPHPPPIHYSVYPCSVEELITFTQVCDFFRTVLFAHQPSGDELLAASIRAAARARGEHESRAYLMQAGRELSRLLKDDYDRLSALLRRIRV
jgi:hypothetical protein